MIEVNLHPGGEKKRKGRRKAGGRSGFELSLPDLSDVNVVAGFRADPWHYSFLVALVVVPLVALFFWLGDRSRAQELESRIEEARDDSVRLADLRELTDSLTSRRRQIQQRIALVSQLDQNRYVWPHLMDEISTALPTLAWLRGVKRQSDLPDMEVQIMGNASTPLVITEYVRNLEASPYIGNVQILGSSRQVTGGTALQSFSLSLRYTPPPRSAVSTVPVAAGGS